MGHDLLAHRPVVIAQDPEDLGRLGTLGERREAAKVAEDRRHRAPMTGQQCLAVRARDERPDLGREEPGQLRPLAVDRPEQAGVLDPDPGLLGEGRHEQDLTRREGPDLRPGEAQRAEDPAVLQDRDAQERPIGADRLLVEETVVRILEDIRDADRPAGQGDPADQAVRPGRGRVRPLVLDEARVAGRRRHREPVAIGQVDRTVRGAAQAGGLFDDGGQHRIEVERGTVDDVEDLVRPRLAVDVVELGVAKALRGERCADPRPQDRPVERLGQVVRRAHLDAADDAGQLLDGRR